MEIQTPAGRRSRSGRMRKLLWFLVFVMVVAGAGTVLFFLYVQKPAPVTIASGPSAPEGVSCLGRIEPEDDVIQIAARSLSGQPTIIGELRVQEGDTVKIGQLIAILDTKPQLEAALKQVEARRKLAESRLEQVKAGAKSADIAAQEAEVARWQAELDNAQIEYDRYAKLQEKGVVPPSGLDVRRNAVETARQLLRQARDRLRGLTEIRQVDVAVAETELESAKADVSYALAELKSASIHSPAAGTVLKIHAWPGEEVRQDGVLELGKTDRMYVVAEVYESDIPRIHAGQRAVIRTEAFPESLEGQVERIGNKVAKDDVLHTDPAEFSDSRIVEVKIRLDDGTRVKGLIHGRVSVIIKP